MKTFIVSVNGERQCTAGVGEHGNIYIPLTYTSLHPDDQAIWPSTFEQLSLSVTGRVGRLSGFNVKDVSWLWDKPLQVGDEVTVRIIESEEVDAPQVISARELAEGLKDRRRAMYEVLKKEFG